MTIERLCCMGTEIPWSDEMGQRDVPMGQRDVPMGQRDVPKCPTMGQRDVPECLIIW